MAEKSSAENPVSAIAAQPASRFAASVLALVALLVALAVVSLGLFVWRGYEEGRTIVASRAAGGAFAASAYVSWLVQANKQTLRRISDTVEMSAVPNGSTTVGDLHRAVAALPGEISIAVFDANGRAVLSSNPDTQAVEIADREYFAAVRNGAEWHIGFLVTSRVSKQKIFTIARRIERDGKFTGAVVSFVPAEQLARFWQSMGFGPGSTIGLLRDDGFLVARYPIPEVTIDLSDYILFTRYLKDSPSGTYDAPASPADGIARLVGYRRVEGLPLVVVVGIPQIGLAEGFYQTIGNGWMAALPIGLALLLVTALVVRLVRQEADTRRALEVSVDRNNILLREVHHRVKNNLQMVMSLIHLQRGGEAEKRDLMQRIAAIAKVHEQIYTLDQVSHIDIGAYLTALADEFRKGYSADIEIDCEIESLMGRIEQAQAVGLILTEVVANAFKHGFPAGGPGTIKIALTRAAAEKALLTVSDDGAGFEPDKGGSGFGMRLIREMTKQVGGTFEFRGLNGTEFRLAFPISESAHAIIAAA